MTLDLIINYLSKGDRDLLAKMLKLATDLEREGVWTPYTKSEKKRLTKLNEAFNGNL